MTNPWEICVSCQSSCWVVARLNYKLLELIAVCDIIISKINDNIGKKTLEIKKPNDATLHDGAWCYQQKEMKWVATSENVPSDMCAEWRLRSAWAFAQSNQNLNWTARIRKLIWFFVGRICPMVRLLITKPYLYNTKPHFYIVKLGLKGVYIFFISAQKHRLWVLVRTASAGRFWRVPTIYVLSRNIKNQRILSENFAEVLSRNLKTARIFHLKVFIFWWWKFQYIWIGVFS